jgi:hypothetical protein
MAIRMGLYAIYDDDMIRLGSIFIHLNRNAIGSRADGNHFHGRLDWDSHGFFRNPIVFQDFLLAFGRGTAMTAHGRHNKGSGIDFFKFTGNFSQNRCDIGDTTAAGGNCHAISGRDNFPGLDF